jgi:hypothetical protein
LEQLAFAPFAYGFRAANLRLNFANGVFNHVAKVFAVENSASAFTAVQRTAESAEQVSRFF